MRIFNLNVFFVSNLHSVKFDGTIYRKREHIWWLKIHLYDITI